MIDSLLFKPQNKKNRRCSFYAGQTPVKKYTVTCIAFRKDILT